MRHSVLLLAVALGCSGGAVRDPGEGEIVFDPDRPMAPSAGVAAPPYTGTEPLVQEAASRYVSGLDLHRKLVMRSCGGANGVCHNQKEYPDLHTPGTFAATVGAPCNVQPGGWETVFDRCERRGDRFRFTHEALIFKEIEVAWIDLVPGEYVERESPPASDAPGLHVYLHEPVPGDRTELYSDGLFVRSFIDDQGNVQELPFVSYETRWWILPDRKHLMGEVREHQVDTVAAIVSSGILQGDHNRNGVFGQRAGNTVTLLNPGRPEQSYLVARLRGHMDGEKVPGTRMPLANQPPSVPDMVALMCWLEQLKPGERVNLADGIRYEGCSYSADPAALNLVGVGITWSGRIKPMLESNCGGCHGGTSPQGDLDLLSEGAHARLLKASTQRPEMKLVNAGNPNTSYLWLKVTGDGSITGSRMPVDPVTGAGMLPDQAMSDLEAWITAGALEN